MESQILGFSFLLVADVEKKIFTQIHSFVFRSSLGVLHHTHCVAPGPIRQAFLLVCLLLLMTETRRSEIWPVLCEQIPRRALVFKCPRRVNNVFFNVLNLFVDKATPVAGSGAGWKELNDFIPHPELLNQIE